MGILTNKLGSKIKNFYFSLEDRYYDFLDATDRRLPVYKLVDPIDKYFPSFILFIILCAAVLVLLVYGAVWAISCPWCVGPVAEYEAIVQVESDEGEPLPNINVIIQTPDGKTDTEKTDEKGVAKFELDSEEVKVDLTVKGGESYQDHTEENVTLKDGETKAVSLRPAGAVVVGPAKEYKIYVVNDRTGGYVNDVPITMEFTCSLGEAPEPRTFEAGANQPFTIGNPEDCGVMEISVKAEGYETATKRLRPDKTVESIRLVPVEEIETTGNMEVIVSDSGGRVADAAVKLIDSQGNETMKGTSSNGTVEFKSVEPGLYTVRAEKDSRIAEQGDVRVTTGKTTSVVLELPELDITKKLHFKILNAKNDQAVEGANVTIFMDKASQWKETTPASGEIELMVNRPDESKDFVALVSKEGFITEMFALTAKNLDSDSVEELEIHELPPEGEAATRHGSVIVKVKDEEGSAIKEAVVSLHRTDFPGVPWNSSPGISLRTNEEGQYKFENIPSNSSERYYAIAEKGDRSGESDKKYLEAGSTIVLPVRIAFGNGTVKVKVMDSETENALEDAIVSFYDASQGSLQLSECLTDASGECPSGDIRADKKVYVKVVKEGYLTAVVGRNGGNIEIVSDDEVEVLVELDPLSILPDGEIAAEYVAVCSDWDCGETVDAVISGTDSPTTYYIKFNLYILENDARNIIHHVRAGLDTQASLLTAGYKMKIKDARAPGSPVILFSTCYTGDPFESKLECLASAGEGAKQVNVKWNSLEKIKVPVTIEVLVEEGLPAEENLTAYYEAKAEFDGTVKSTETGTLTIPVNTLVCPDEEGIAWMFSLMQSGVELGLAQGENATQLNLDEEYELWYILKNCTSQDLSGSSVEVSNRQGPLGEEDDAITFPEIGEGATHSIAMTKPFGADAVYFPDAPLKIKASKETHFTYLSFGISGGGLTAAGPALKFSVVSLEQLRVVNLPEFLEIGTTITLNGTVVDKETAAPIEGAWVEVRKTSGGVTQTLATLQTTAAGTFSYEQGDSGDILRRGDEVAVIVSKAGYATKVIPIKVKHEGEVNQNYASCISIEPLEKELNSGESAAFKIKTDECDDKVNFQLVSLLKLSEKEFKLEKTDEKEVEAKAEGERVFQGIYPIFVKARFDYDAQLRFVTLAEVTVNNPNACFKISKYVYDLSEENEGTDSGMLEVEDACYYSETSDVENPQMDVDTAKVDLESQPEIPETYTVNWKVTGSALGDKAGSEVTIDEMTLDQGSFEIQPRSAPLFEVKEFEISEYIQKLKQDPNCSGCSLMNVSITVDPQTEEVLMWIEGNKIKGLYKGTLPQKEYEFILTNRFLDATEYAFITMRDYVQGGGD